MDDEGDRKGFVGENPQEEEEEEEEEEEDVDIIEDIPNFPQAFFTVELKKTKSFRHHAHDVVDENSYIVKLREHAVTNANATLGDIQIQLHALFDSLLEEVNENYDPNDLVRVFITHLEMVNTNIIVGPDYLGNINTQVIMDQIADVIRSNNFIPADGNLSINVAAIRNVKGLKMPHVTNISKDLTRKGCLISIPNDDELCLPRSIAVAVAHYDMKNNPGDRKFQRAYKTMRQNDRSKGKRLSRSSLQKTTAIIYQHRAKIGRQKAGVITDVPAYEKALCVGITVISARSGNKKVHQGNPNYEKQIFLYHTQGENEVGHFSVLTKVNALLGRSYYCSNCDKGFNNNNRHKCAVWCNICGGSSCLWGEEIPCKECNATCRSKDCFDRHKKIKKGCVSSKCDMMLFCRDCGVPLKIQGQKDRNEEEHVCGETYCRNCHVYHLGDHSCYMRSTPAGGKGHQPKKFIFYDFESMQTEKGDHVPNLVVSHSICENCCHETLVTKDSKCNTCGDRCSICWKTSRDGGQFAMEPCQGCGHREKIFQGRNTVNNFCSWLITEQHRNFTVMAHNARSYDSYFIYQYLIENSITPQIIFRGSKIMYCHIARRLSMTFLDSLNFLNMALSQVPKSFGLTEMKKGFFPHLYNHETVWQQPDKLVLKRLPSKRYYDLNNMNGSRRKEFLQWYKKNRRGGFDMKKELLEYCRSDVNILLSGCWKFRDLVMESTGPENPVDPFDYTTIASVCLGIFRSKFLPENWKVLKPENEIPSCVHGFDCECPWTEARKVDGDAPLEIWNQITGSWTEVGPEIKSGKRRFVSSPIGLPPPHGYTRRDNYSKQSMEWIKWFEKANNVTVQHALSPGGEKRVVKSLTRGRKIVYRLDGYFTDRDGKEHALEFQGCWFHGCKKCYPRDRKTLSIHGKSLETRLRETEEKEKKLEEAGFAVHSIWACEWEMMKHEDKDVLNYVKGLDLVDPLQIRDAYFGGRTNGIVLKKLMEGDEKGKYADFCSLYPDVLKYNAYPIGHPTHVVNDFKSVEYRKCDGKCNFQKCLGWHWKMPYFGFIKAKILPPRGLMFPVLPVRINNKLMFTLCRSCAQEEKQESCTCPNNDRSLLHTWTTVEVEVALNRGYSIEKIYEVLHWEEKSTVPNRKDRDTSEDGLFTNYINTFLRLKAEASGFPKGVNTSEEKSQYVADYQENEGVLLDTDNISPNPGLRSIAKLALNSFYGKFGQKTNMKKTVYLTSSDQIYAMLTDFNKIIKDFHVLNENMVVMDYVRSSEFEETSTRTNVAIAAFCTSYARLKLWHVLDKLGERVLYHDTDSVIYTHRPGQYDPPMGKFLGDLTDELTCKGVGCQGCDTGHWIVDFISCGAKNYAYKLNTGQVTCKVRGFSLNFAASKVVNLESMKKALDCWKSGTEMGDMTTVTTMILRDRKTAVVYSKEMSKNYGVVYNKRIVKDNFETLPYGF